MSHLDTGTRTRLRPSLLLPDTHTWIDLLMVLALGTIALSAWATSFTGWYFLAVGCLGLFLGVLVTHVVRALGWPVIWAAVLLLVLFFVLGGPLCLRSLGDVAVLPGLDVFGEIAEQAVFGWKDLLTTLPPVDGDGPLLVLPWLLGLVVGFLGTVASEAPVRRPWLAALLPVLVMTGLLCGVILLGVRHPAALWLQGALFAGLALGWAALRVRRATAAVRGGARGWLRLVAAATMIAFAAALALPASALFGGADDSDRVVARSWVEPPFDIGRYPSPLAGFRRYVDPQGRRDTNNLHDTSLFTISGVQAGTRVRFATMDRYDGMVWGATDDPVPGVAGDSFQRVSSTIDNPVEGREVEATVTLDKGYSGVWLPTVGALTSMDFQIGDPLGKADVFRYNLATSTAVVPSGLQAGDTYSFTAIEPDDRLDSGVVASDQYLPAPAGTEFIQGPAEKWTTSASDPMGRVLAAAEHLRAEGRYSDGIGRTQRGFHAGHGLRRLGDEFVNAPQMVGNDEQYAAVMALVANQIGVPARVVMGAVVPDGGTVTGADVSAWVEVMAADGTWRTLPTEEFMSRKPPAEQIPETNTPMTGTVVPPPNPVPPPSDTGEQTDADLKERKVRKKDADEEADDVLAALPGWVRWVATYVALPLLLLALVLGSIVGLKAWRRRRRRSASAMSARVVGAWRELVDHARDLGQPVPLGPTVTRREQSAAIPSDRAGSLARRADGVVFGPEAPGAEAAASYWESVESERRAMSRAAGRRQRWLAVVNLATLRPRRWRR